MIFTALISGFIYFFVIIFSALPFNIPQMPTAISDGLQVIINQLHSVFSLLSYIYSPVFFTALIVIFSALIIFDPIYNFLFWVLRKIPFIDVRQ